MGNSIVRALYEYWHDVRAGRLAPYRGDIDPRAISRVLPHAFILERTDDGQLRYRLAGTRLCEAFGAELRGMNPLALWRGACRLKLQDTINRVLESPATAQIVSMVETESGYIQRMEHIYLPMRDSLGAMNRILGCAVVIGAAKTTGRVYRPVSQFITETSWTPIDRSANAPPERPLHQQSWAAISEPLRNASRVNGEVFTRPHGAGPSLRLVAVNGDPVAKRKN